MKRILLGLLIIVLFAGTVVAGTWAFFSETETSRENVLQAGSLDLEVDGER